MFKDKNMIRDAVSGDYIDICKICCDDLGYNCHAELIKERIEKLDSDRERVFVAVADDRVVGFVHAEKFNTLYYESMVNIQGLAVAKEYCKNGLGRALMDSVENWARECNVSLIRLNSGFERKEAHGFYRAIGYDNEKEQIRFMKRL